jgi:hypothetical protein
MKICESVLAVMSLAVGTASICSAVSITYDIDLTVGVGGVTGDIVTDGTVGPLGKADIIDWNFLLNNGTTTFHLLGPLSGSNSELFDEAGVGDLSATATQLLFNFSGGGTNYFYFVTTAVGNQSVLCFQNTQDCAADSPGAGVALFIESETPPRFTSLSGTHAIATTASAPEPSTISLLAGGIVFLGFQRRKANAELVSK